MRGAGKGLSPAARIALVLVGLLALAALGYFAAIAPKHSAASDLDREIASVEAQIAEYRAAAPRKKAATAAKTAQLFKLAKAMPDDTDMSEVILELNEVAADSGIVFDSITPGGAGVRDGYGVLPITVVFRGNFYTLSDFLYRLRNLVSVRDERLLARGRLLSVDTVSFTEDEEQKFPHIRAELTVNAFVFGGGAPAGDPAASSQAAGGTTSTTQTSTTTTAPSQPPPPTGTQPSSSAAPGP